MGNKECVPPRPIVVPPPRLHVGKDKDVRAVRSVSNPSLMSQEEDDEELVVVSISQQFNDVYMDIIYKKFSDMIGKTIHFVPIEILKTISNILETVSSDENIMFLSMKFYEAIYLIDDSWNGVFSTCAERNPLKYADARGFNTENRIMMHIMMTFRTLKIIASALEEEKQDMAMEIIDLLALSHIIMKVDINDFKMYIVRIIKSLIHFKIITEELMSPFVYFNMNVIREVEHRMLVWQRSHSALLNQMVDGLSAPSREYFRELKTWRTYVLGVYKTMAKPLQMFEKQIETSQKLEPDVPTESIGQDNWKIIKLLKKGYKYRTKTEMEVYF